MSSSLFEIFEPMSIMGFPLNFLSLGLPLVLLPVRFWVKMSRMGLAFRKLAFMIHLELCAVFGKYKSPGTTNVPVMLFFMIALNNLMGLVPYVFTGPTHFSVTFALSAPLWLGSMYFSWHYQKDYALAHLVPSGTPAFLLPFMVLIELLSTLMRPLTLSVRLGANMIAGHLLFALLSAGGSPMKPNSFNMVCVISLVPLGLLESGVAVIQAFVFSLLSALYVHEVQTYKLMKN